MAICKECIHYEPCFDYGNILDPIHGGVICDSFSSAADVVPKSEVAREIFEEIDKTVFADMDFFKELKKKYTEAE